MGNQESTQNPERYGEYEPSECGHSWEVIRSYKVVKLRWIRVPMANVHATNSVEAVRWLASPVFAPLIDKAVKSDLSHECIEILYDCRSCGRVRRLTAEILGKNDKRLRQGFYQKEKDTRHEYCPNRMTVRDVESIFKYKMGGYYDIITDNCSHWCSRLWAILRRVNY